MKLKITIIIALGMLTLMLASCGLPSIQKTDTGESETAEAVSATDAAEEATATDAGAFTATDAAAAVRIIEVIDDITETVTDVLTTVITTEPETEKETVTTTAPSTTETTTAPSTAPQTTAPAVSTVDNGFDGYSGRVETVNRTYTSDLKYGVDLHRHVTIYYGFDSNGKRYVLKEEETGRSYDRSTYIASYNDLLPAARQNRQNFRAMINEILRLTNNMRAEKGIAPLRLDEKLTEQANVRAEEIAWSGKHSHYRPNLKSFSSIFYDNGYDTGFSGENLGWYYATAAEVCAAWKASQGHYENIINPRFTKIGIGVAKEADPTKNYAFVQHFYGE